jgi:hypothetical protein
VTIVTAQAQGWELTSIPEGPMVTALAGDGFPAAVVVHGRGLHSSTFKTPSQLFYLFYYH